ncbi:MAG: MOSC domain-containing protein [Isosphaeraceae bacterium]
MIDSDSVKPLLTSIQIGLPRPIESVDEPWTSGIFKTKVSGPIFLRETNLVGDGQADLKNHGGPDRAVLAYSADHYHLWCVELAQGDLPFGWFGENLTILGLDERTVCIGDVFSIGPARVQVSQPRQPCWKLAARTGVEDLPSRVVKTMRGGWYLRVLKEGTIESGMSVELQERFHPAWPVSAAFEVANFRRTDRAATLALADLPELSTDWRTSARKRAGSV